MEAQSNMYTLHARVCMFGADLYAQSVLNNKISALEFSTKFIKSALLVGQQHLNMRNHILAKHAHRQLLYTKISLCPVTPYCVLVLMTNGPSRLMRPQVSMHTICDV